MYQGSANKVIECKNIENVSARSWLVVCVHIVHIAYGRLHTTHIAKSIISIQVVLSMLV
mgnify:CR=1 FL=1